MKRHLLAALPFARLALAIAALAPAVASAWAPASQATVHPGVMAFTDGAQCTSNFVFTRGSNVYLGQAAHCSSTGGQTSTDGCDTGSLPIGTPVEVTGASRPGTLVYNSWRTMQARGETNANACAYNDFALVRIDPADVGRVNPSVPGFGGPTGVGAAGGLGVDRLLVRQLLAARRSHQAQPQAGRRGPEHGRRLEPHRLHGDAGNSRRLGQRLPERLRPGDRRAEHAAGPALAGSNGVGDLAKEIAYMRANSSFSGVQLAPGTKPFNPSLASAILGA